MTELVAFTATSARHALPFLFAGQAQREFFVNQALAQIDALLHPVVQGQVAAPPADPQPGQSWLVAAAATGEWTGHSESLANWDGQQWHFLMPAAGMSVYDATISARWHFDGTWKRTIAPANPAGGSVVDNEARAAISAICAALRTCGVFSDA